MLNAGMLNASLGNMFQYMMTITVHFFFLLFKSNVLYFILCPLPLVLSLRTTEKSLALPSSLIPTSYIYTFKWSLWAFCSSGCGIPALLTLPVTSSPFSLSPCGCSCSCMSMSFLYYPCESPLIFCVSPAMWEHVSKGKDQKFWKVKLQLF